MTITIPTLDIMNTREYMIVDLERKGDKRMFITEQVSSIQRNEQGLWTVVFGNNSFAIPT